MKILPACEGPSEVYLLKSLIDRGYLSFDCPLLLEEPIKLRQLDEIAPIINSLPVNEEIIVYRIGDTLKEELSLKKFKLRKQFIETYRICTKTEIEILVILHEGLYDDYIKSHRDIKPKSYLQSVMRDYDPKTYFEKHDVFEDIREYKRIKKHQKDELYLFDLLNKDK